MRSAAVSEDTRDLDVLFRFKIDFVRRRALPLIKGGAHIALDPADAAAVEHLASHWPEADREMAIATAGCALMDREAATCEERHLQPRRRDRGVAGPLGARGGRDEPDDLFRGRERLKKVLLDVHGEIFTAAFWRHVQQHHRDGEVLEVLPYHPHRVPVASSH